MMSPETFWTLLHDSAHWEFELFLMALFDGIVGCLLWPFLRRHWDHYVPRDRQDRFESNAAADMLQHVPIRYEFFMCATDRHGKIFGPRIKF